MAACICLASCPNRLVVVLRPRPFFGKRPTNPISQTSLGFERAERRDSAEKSLEHTHWRCDAEVVKEGLTRRHSDSHPRVGENLTREAMGSFVKAVWAPIPTRRWSLSVRVTLEAA